ncbi:O-methyltransferase I [Seminavis robusta]|uniref:O-methyltransferase I n=1 Tax=Seminavis robusta TaxID=568900 RepID=A0A9N8EDC4_9STRA|nr:O-methyltransferase I [Seminavis robusta]|eukprot:Sro830_g208250.1 O-methyltransferase I (440) ;mRNA; r:30991-32859
MVKILSGTAKSSQAANPGTSSGSSKKRCTRRDLMLGFWVGIALAAIYLNTKRKPVIHAAASTTTKTKRTSPASSGDTVPIMSKSTTAEAETVPEPATTAETTTSTTETTTSSSPKIEPPAETSSSTTSTSSTTTGTSTGRRTIAGFTPKPGHKDFQKIGANAGTDKVWGADTFERCLQDQSTCPTPDFDNPKCRTLQGHFYHTLYNRWLGNYSLDDAEPFQFLEIGFFNGRGYDAYKEFLPRAETHSIEIACLPEGPREEGKWPWGNFAKENKHYQEYLDTNQLHCGDGADYDFLHETWTTHMKRPDAPPLKVVVDDAAHISDHMAKSVFFWFPKIEPGGILVVEDIQPIHEANKFRTDFLPQMMKDLHYCGDPKFPDKACFPTLWPLLHSIHCEMHICVFERNEMPAVEYDMERSIPPPHALNAEECLLKASGGATYG